MTAAQLKTSNERTIANSKAAKAKEEAKKATAAARKAAAEAKKADRKANPVSTPKTVSKSDLGSALTAVQHPKSLAWKCICGETTDYGTGLDGYIAALRGSIEAANAAIALAEKAQAERTQKDS